MPSPVARLTATRSCPRSCGQRTSLPKSCASCCSTPNNDGLSLKNYAVSDRAQLFNRYFHHVAVLQVAGLLHRHRNAGRRACRNDVAGLQSHRPAELRYYAPNRKHHVAGRRVLPRLAVYLGRYHQILRIGDLVLGSDPRPAGRKRVDALATRELLVLELDVTRGNVVKYHVAKCAVKGFFLRDLFRLLTDNDRKFCLIVKARHKRRADDIFKWLVKRRSGLHEYHRLVRGCQARVACMVVIVECKADNLGRIWYRHQQLYRVDLLLEQKVILLFLNFAKPPSEHEILDAWR